MLTEKHWDAFVASLLSLTGVIVPSARPVLADLPKVAREGPEATTLISRAACVLTVPLRLTDRLGTPSRSRNLVGLKRPLVQQASSGLQSPGEP